MTTEMLNGCDRDPLWERRWRRDMLGNTRIDTARMDRQLQKPKTLAATYHSCMQP